MNQLVEQQICEPVTIVIFGASGDLTHRKLIPALYAAYQQNLYRISFRLLDLPAGSMTHPYFRG